MPKKKRSKKAPGAKAAKTGDSPFFRPFADLSQQGVKTSSGAAPKDEIRVRRRAQAAAPPRSAPEDPDDLLTFERLMSGVEPLDESGARRVSTSQDDVRSAHAERARARVKGELEASEREALDKLHALVNDGTRFEIRDDGRSIVGRRRGVDGGLVRRMRNGEVPIDATLDLHDLKAREARQAVEAFVRDRRARGDRVVLLVHGHGQSAQKNQPILRGEVAAWLSDGAASKHVSAFLTAPPAPGGRSAMSVLLAHPSETHRGMR